MRTLKQPRRIIRMKCIFAYGDLLNYFQPDVLPQFTIFNTKLDKEVFRENTLFEDQNDGADDLRHAMNAVLEEKINEASVEQYRAEEIHHGGRSRRKHPGSSQCIQPC